MVIKFLKIKIRLSKKPVTHIFAYLLGRFLRNLADLFHLFNILKSLVGKSACVISVFNFPACGYKYYGGVLIMTLRCH